MSACQREHLASTLPNGHRRPALEAETKIVFKGRLQCVEVWFDAVKRGESVICRIHEAEVRFSESMIRITASTCATETPSRQTKRGMRQRSMHG